MMAEMIHVRMNMTSFSRFISFLRTFSFRPCRFLFISSVFLTKVLGLNAESWPTKK